MHNSLQELQNYLTQKDDSLLVRRLLDAAKDTNNYQLIKEAIDISTAFKSLKTTNDIEFWHHSVQTFIQKLTPLFQSTTKQNKTLLLQANNIAKQYSKGNFCLQSLSLQIEAGQILGVVGENGNGKTTLLRCLARQLSIDSGEIKYPQLLQPDDYAIKNHVAFIPQRIPRWYGKLKDNLHFAASLANSKGHENEISVTFMLQRLNLEPYANLTWEQISSGYRTRFEIARVLLQKPQLLILDEPLANLDINAQQTILSDLRYIAKSNLHPMGIVLSSQQLHEVEKIADNVLYLKQGACLHQLNTQQASTETTQYVIEVETTLEKVVILQALQHLSVEVKYNGVFYTISSPKTTAMQMLETLVQQNVLVIYYRDITHSTKKFF